MYLRLYYTQAIDIASISDAVFTMNTGQDQLRKIDIVRCL